MLALSLNCLLHLNFNKFNVFSHQDCQKLELYKILDQLFQVIRKFNVRFQGGSTKYFSIKVECCTIFFIQKHI